MRTIAIINQKGGIGKTTTAVNLSAALAELGQRVCLVDLDPQAHATLHLGVEPAADSRSIYEVLIGSASLAEVRRQVDQRLWLVGSHLDLAGAEVELAGVVGREVIFRDKLAEDPDDFDYLILDCPPSLGLLTLNALSAVREVIIPLQPHFLALHGLSRLLDTMTLVRRRLNPRLSLTGVVLCLYDSGTRLAAEVAQSVEDFFASQRGRASAWSAARVFATRIRRNIRLAEAPSHGQTIFQYAPKSPGAEDYRSLTGEIFLHGEPPARPARPFGAAEPARGEMADIPSGPSQSIVVD